MKIDINIEWVIGNDQLGIICGSTEDVTIDTDYTESDENNVLAAVEDELAQKYGVSMKHSRNENTDDGDFVILNLDAVLEDLKFEEFKDKTQYSGM